MTLTLHSYKFSVYGRIVRMTLAERGLAYGYREVDPFAESLPADYLALQPFGRVPVLEHDGFVLYETAAITRYLDEVFEGPALQPPAPSARARLVQIVAVIDSYGYWPLVRQFFSQRVFAPLRGEVADEEEIAVGLAASRRVLGALEDLASGELFLLGSELSLADLHLAPMLAYFTAAPEGAAALAAQPKLARWWAAMRERESLKATDPGVPGD